MAGQSFALQLVTFNALAPLATSQGAPVTLHWPLTRVLLRRLEVMVPSGHNGLTGIAVEYNGQTILPWANPRAFLVANGETVGADMDDQELGDSGLDVVMFNTDIWGHTFYLRAVVNQNLRSGPASASTAVVALG